MLELWLESEGACREHAYAREHGMPIIEWYHPYERSPVACLDTCPCGHWKRTAEGGKIPKDQTELNFDTPGGLQ